MITKAPLISALNTLIAANDTRIDLLRSGIAAIKADKALGLAYDVLALDALIADKHASLCLRDALRHLPV